jgi:hypothetical protein
VMIFWNKNVMNECEKGRMRQMNNVEHAGPHILHSL